ncbi:uncharacterized protein LOC135392026 [Ornithodoros turicata]|uniref:uncharacterized protein LOC135392026 n=1 Tax=Ornithodoros turicata TaxID=34597 RepID=UPI003139513C
MDIILVALTIISLRCVAVPAASSSKDFQKTVLQEVNTVIGDSVPHECDTRRDLRKPTCSCDPSCNLYGDCCIDVAKEVPRERYMCTQLERDGPYVWVKASCTGRRTTPMMKFKCEGQFTSNVRGLTYIIDVPAFHKPTKTLYRNLYCVLCKAGLTDIYRWHSRLEWIGQVPRNMSKGTLLTQLSYDVERRIYWVRHQGTTYNTTFRAAEFRWENFTRAFNTAPCSPALDTCPKGSHPALVRQCELYAAYYTPNDTVDVTYKNYHCALCNGVPRTAIENDYKRVTYLQSSITTSLRKVGSEISVPYVGGGSSFQFLFDPSIADSRCGKHEISAPYMNSCLPASCPENTRFERSTGVCIGRNGSRSCPWVVFEEAWVTVLPNRSLYLNFSNEIVGPDEYKTGGWAGHVLVCVSHPVTVVLDPTQEIIAEVCLALSTVCLLLLIVVYIALPQLRARASGRAILCLAMSLALAQVLFLVSNDLPPYTTSCHLVAIVLHYCYLASFFWMNTLAIDVCRSLATHVFDSGSEHLFLWYSGYAWLCPMVLVGVAVLLDVFLPEAVLSPHYGGHLCWICHRGSLMAFFLAPVAILLLVNAVLFILTARSLRSARRSTAKNRRDDPGIPFLLYVKLVLAFGLTWAFGFAAALTASRWLWYPFIVLSGLQGAFLFAAFACKKSVFSDLRQRFLPKKKKSEQETSGPTASTSVQPLRERRSLERTCKKAEYSKETHC